MTIRPLSLTGEYHLVWSGDPALDAPPRPAEGAKEDDPALVTWKEWITRLQVAQRTGTKEAWAAVLKPGQVPTLFRMRQVPSSVAAKMLSIANGDGVTTWDVFPLAYRLALVGIENWAPGAEFKFDRRVDKEHPKLGQIAEEKAADAVGLAILAELGSIVMSRLMEADPLS